MQPLLPPAHVFDAARFAIDSLGWIPDAVQAEVLRTKRRRVLLNWGRQCGKTILAAAKTVHVAAGVPNALCIWVSAQKEHTAEAFLHIDRFLAHMGCRTKSQPGKERARVLVDNGSRILGIAARDMAVRSYTADFVVIDEASQVKPGVYDAITPVLAIRNGAMWVLGTPRGKRGTFWDIAAKADANEWLKSTRPTAACGRVSPEFLESERKLKGDAVMRREYGCEFLDDGTTLLVPEKVDSLFT
jgi:hypothetical protein